MIVRTGGPLSPGPGVRRWLARLGGDGIGPRFAVRPWTNDLEAPWIGVAP